LLSPLSRDQIPFDPPSARDVPGANTLRTDKIFVYEIARGSGVQKRFDGMYFASVSGTDLYREDDRHSAGIEGVGRESSG